MNTVCTCDRDVPEVVRLRTNWAVTTLTGRQIDSSRVLMTPPHDHACAIYLDVDMARQFGTALLAAVQEIEGAHA